METVKKPRIRLLIVGIDAGTFARVEPWAREGKLPTLARLMREGCWGSMRSTAPPITPPAWTSFMTGKNPGKHGLFHFIEPRRDSYEMRYTNARSRDAKTVWTLLNEAGLRCGVVNVPFTFPPELLDGFMISGMDTPDEKSDFVHPKELRTELERVVGPISLDVRFLGYMHTDKRRAEVLSQLEEIDNQRTQVARYLMQNHPADIMMFAYTSVDTAQHYFLHYSDPSHPFHDAEGAKKFGDAVLSTYQRLDRAIEDLMRELPEDAGVMVVSDHGGGPIPDRIIHVNRLLAQIGLLQYKSDGRERTGALLIRKPLKRLYLALRSSLSSKHKVRLAKMFPSLRRLLESSYTGLNAIDWSRTKAYCSEVLSSPPNIWINLKGVRPNGIVEMGAEYDALIRQVSEALYGLKDPITGKPVIRKVYRREELYTGSKVDQAPDLTLAWWEDKSYMTKPSSPEDRNEPVVTVKKSLDGTGSEWSGTHTMEGIALFWGHPFGEGRQLDGVDINDIAPTLLHLFNLPVPDDMDGRVLSEVFTARDGGPRPVRYQTVGSSDSRGDDEGTYSDEESRKIQERLQSLGYLQ